MPIAEVLDATRPLDERILAFFRSAPAEAYSLPEIYVGVERVDPTLRQLVTVMWTMAILEGRAPLPAPWTDALNQLVVSNQIRKSTVRGTDYYWLDRGTP